MALVRETLHFQIKAGFFRHKAGYYFHATEILVIQLVKFFFKRNFLGFFINYLKTFFTQFHFLFQSIFIFFLCPVVFKNIGIINFFALYLE